MRTDPAGLIDGYLDDLLTDEQHDTLSQWIKASPENAFAFASAAMLHDRLRNESNVLKIHAPSLHHDADSNSESNSNSDIDASHDSQTFAVQMGEVAKKSDSAVDRRRHSVKAIVSTVATVSLFTAGVVIFLKSFVDSPTSAAVSELNRLIELNAMSIDRTYRITVEEKILPKRGRRGPAPEDGRPPKASLDGAILYARDDQQFVLSRETENGPFVTGSNGKVSWAVRPDGPVRFSTDLNRFNRDLPGHEHEMSLVNIHDGLERLRQSYDVQILPVEDARVSASAEPATRLLVAVRHPGERGPRRVEISYEVESGLIQQMRFIEMPYGPESLTLRMTLLSEESLDDHFFDHEAHHDASRRVEAE